MINFIKESLWVFFLLAIYGIAQADYYGDQVRGTSCDCMAQKSAKADIEYGLSSPQSMSLMDAVIYDCNIKTKQEFYACKEVS